MKGLLTDQVSDRLMEAARSAEGVQFLKDMPCEMVFEASKGFVSYQKTASGQLPVFHLMGHVTELRGAFPYGVSSLYFDDDDKQYLFRDCLIDTYDSGREIFFPTVSDPGGAVPQCICVAGYGGFDRAASFGRNLRRHSY